MRWLRMILFALAGVPILCTALFVHEAVSVERFGAGAPTGRGTKITESLKAGPVIDVESVGGVVGTKGIERHVDVTGFRHSSPAVGAEFVSASGTFGEKIGALLQMLVDNGRIHTPALGMGLLIVLIVPPLVAAGWLARAMQPDGNATYRVNMPMYEAKRGRDRGSATDQHEDFMRDANFELGTGARGAVARRFAFGRRALVVRVGREDDNEIQIRDHTVHRYHAAIHRSADSGISITDLSSKNGNGIVLNGKRVTHAQLKDGDYISLGAVALTFRLKAA